MKAYFFEINLSSSLVVTTSLNIQMRFSVRKGRLHSSDSQDKVLIYASNLLFFEIQALNSLTSYNALASPSFTDYYTLEITRNGKVAYHETPS
ncbi:hypothetical protein TMatcc_006916 [Talaromyces marneffei ATCC 18224]